MTSNLKRIVAKELLATRTGFLVSMNVDDPYVELPEHIKLQALRLSPKVAVISVIIGLRLPVPIQDLIVDAEGITATLSFDRNPHLCYAPWDAVVGFADADGRPIVAFNPDAMPMVPKEPKQAMRMTMAGRKKKPSLRLIQGGEPESA